MEEMISSDLEVTLKNDVYRVDVPGERLVLKDDPAHWIHYEHMYFRNGGYEFCYDPKRKYVHIPFEEANGTVMINLPLLIDTDRLGMLDKYQLKEADLTVRELQALKDQEAALLYRLKGNLPMIDIANSAYGLEVESQFLSPLYGPNGTRIYLPAFIKTREETGYHFLLEEKSGHAYPFIELEERKGQRLIEVHLPSLQEMDPIGMAIKQGIHALDLVWTHPQKHWTKARTYPLKQHKQVKKQRKESLAHDKGFTNQGNKVKPKIKR